MTQRHSLPPDLQAFEDRLRELKPLRKPLLDSDAIAERNPDLSLPSRPARWNDQVRLAAVWVSGVAVGVLAMWLPSTINNEVADPVVVREQPVQSVDTEFSPSNRVAPPHGETFVSLSATPFNKGRFLAIDGGLPLLDEIERSRRQPLSTSDRPHAKRLERSTAITPLPPQRQLLKRLLSET